MRIKDVQAAHSYGSMTLLASFLMILLLAVKVMVEFKIHMVQE